MRHKQECSAPSVRLLPYWVRKKNSTYRQLLGCVSCGMTDHPGWLPDTGDDKEEVEG